MSSATPAACIPLADSPSTNTPKPVDMSSDAQPMNEVSETGPLAMACILNSRNAAVTPP